MNKLLTVILITTLVFTGFVLVYLDKVAFLCPIVYKGDIVVRNDSRGEGAFAASRGGGRRMHNGIDLLAEISTPVFACRSGRVLKATSNNGMGNFVIISHPGGITTIYGHLSRIDTRAGDIVSQGQLIGAVGKTGNANHPDMLAHLHFEVRNEGVPQDPLEYLE